MVEKGKVRTAIDAKFKGKSLSKNFKDSLAAKWAAKIENEEDIEEFINEREDIILEASAESDRIRTLAAKEAEKTLQDKIIGKKEGEEKTEPIIDDSEMTPAMKAILAKIEGLTTTVTQFQQQKQTESIAEKFAKDERLKGIPDWMLQGHIPSKEDEFETKATELSTKWNEFVTQNKLQSFGADAPGSGAQGGSPGDVKQPTKEELDAVMSQM